MTLIKELITIATEDVLKAPIEAKLGLEFNEMIIVTIETKEGFIDVLFDNKGQLLQPGINDKTVKVINSFFNKSFTPGSLGNDNCWCQYLS